MKHLAFFLAWCGVVTAAATQTLFAQTVLAQTLSPEPMTAGGGRVVIGGTVAAGVGSPDPGYFDYSDYQRNTLRELRIGLSAAVRASSRLTFLGELRTENFTHARPFALFARIQPLPGRRFDIQIGRIPPTFGSFPRRAYGTDNPLIGYPLAYQYLTSLRPDAVPATVDELLRMRGRGWESQFTVGSTTPDRGVPVVTAFSWDTGVQTSVGVGVFDITVAVTNGSLSNPRVRDDNSGKQLAARVSARPAAGVVAGASFARGQFLARRVLDLQPVGDRSGSQQAFGADIEYAWGHLVLRGDGVLSTWSLPIADVGRNSTSTTLKALALSGEGRYTLMPGVYAALRLDRLTFNRLQGAGGPLSWDAPVTRLEIGGGYYLLRNLVARASWQRNRRDGGRETRADLAAAQLLYWF